MVEVSERVAQAGAAVRAGRARRRWPPLVPSFILAGVVVVALWADAIESADGGCRYLLWAPNVDGSRPWSDTPAGRERLEHCRGALQQGRAEGLLVYGERCAGHIPEDKAYTVLGVDPETVVVFQVERRGAEYWATWGRKRLSSSTPG